MTSLAEIESVIVMLGNPLEVLGVKAQRALKWTATLFWLCEQRWLEES